MESTNYPISEGRVKQLKTLLKKIKIDHKKLICNNKHSDFAIINEALTHSSANSAHNYEKLEFLGDAVLRLAASDFIENKFPTMQVGERSALRSQLVSDSWLTNVGKSIQIENNLIIGPKVLGDSSALATLQAEATEALIGAIYVCFRELTQIQSWLKPYWQETSIKILEDPHRQNYKSALQEWSQSKGFQIPKYEVQELSQIHGDPKRFFCTVHIADKVIGKGWGRSHKSAEKEAASVALKEIIN